MKKVLSLVLTAALSLSLAACGTKTDSTSTKQDDKKTIVIGASATPHAEILEQVKPILAKEGYDLQIKVFDDYVLPNKALDEGSIDANFFQHIPYLEDFNAKNNTKLVATTKVHIEPMGIYSHKIKDVKSVTNGAVIAIPSDPSNGSRALKLLAKAGIIKLNDKDTVSKLDITENSLNVEIKDMDAAQLPRTLDDVTLAVINSNYAIQANLNPTKDSLFTEDKDSPYANVIVVKEGNENAAWAKALDKAITSAEIKKFIEDKYQGQIVPAF